MSIHGVYYVNEFDPITKRETIEKTKSVTKKYSASSVYKYRKNRKKR